MSGTFNSLVDQAKQQFQNLPIKNKYFGIGVALFGLLSVLKIKKTLDYHKKIFDENDKKLIASKSILITGCDSGFGNALAHKLSNIGYCVIATCLKPESVNIFMSDKKFNKNCIAIVMDVTKMESIEKCKKTVSDFLKNNNKILWGIVNNAGIAMPGMFEMISKNLQDYACNVLLMGPMNVTRAFLPLIYGRSHLTKSITPRNDGGRIVNVSSVAAKICGGIGMSSYGACKTGLTSYTHSLRMELAPKFGIWCSCIHPGYFLTGIYTMWAVWVKRVKNECDKEIWKIYNGDKFEMKSVEFIEEIQESTLMKRDLSPVIDRIIHGLTAKYPKRSYNPYSYQVAFMFTWTPWWLFEKLVYNMNKDFFL